MSEGTTLDELARMVAQGFGEATEDRKGIRETLNEHTETLQQVTAMLEEHGRTLDEHTKLLQQLVRFDEVQDRLRVIETELGIDSRSATRQS